MSYLEEAKMVLEKMCPSTIKTHQDRQAHRIFGLLQLALPPVTNINEPDESKTDALYLTCLEAKRRLKDGEFYEGVMLVTLGQQTSPLDSISNFLRECYDDSAKVSIQDPAAKVKRHSCRNITVKDVKQRFTRPAPDNPWNLLELGAHHMYGLRPSFIQNEDCRLLTKVKLPSGKGQTCRSSYARGWKEVEVWTMISLAGTESGASTEPHQDSHGFGTWITMQEGRMGFGWLSRPTAQERAEWESKPLFYAGGRWRYVVLEPGQTVYFPSGTVHFVFRLPAGHAQGGNTMAYGGHVLRCSQIERWARCILAELRNTDITNEDKTESIPGYLDQVADFVAQAAKEGDDCLKRWGGREAVDEFLRLRKEIKKL